VSVLHSFFYFGGFVGYQLVRPDNVDNCCSKVAQLLLTWLLTPQTPKGAFPCYVILLTAEDAEVLRRGRRGEETEYHYLFPLSHSVKIKKCDNEGL
jgi:hypothetical protein